MHGSMCDGDDDNADDGMKAEKKATKKSGKKNKQLLLTGKVQACIVQRANHNR